MMNAITDPLERVVETMQWFMTATEIQVVHIVTSESVRIAVLEHIAAMEHFSTNTKPFIILEAPVERADDGWETRTEELRDDIDDLCARLIKANEGIDVHVMPDKPIADTSFGAFALTLNAAIECLTSPLDGLVIVLSPLWVRDSARWMEDVTALIEYADFRTLVRWVIVDIEKPVCAVIAEKLGELAMSVDARIQTAAMRNDLSTMVAAVESAPDGAMGMRMGGFAGPDDTPPPRKGKPKPLTPEQAEKVGAEYGIPAANLLVKPMQEIRTHMLRAGEAMMRGDSGSAVAKTREARAIARTHKLHKEAIMMTLMMGAYALQGRAPDTAAALFREAKADAERRGHADLAVQAQMALAAGLFAANKTREAALEYAEAGQLAAASDQRVLAIEAYRTSGQLLVTLGDRMHAAQAFCRACQISGEGEPEEWRNSSAPEAARALADLFVKHEQFDSAALMLRLAIEMETMGESEANRAEACHAG